MEETKQDTQATQLKTPHPGGRNSVITEVVVTKLIGALQRGWSITKACEYAKISRETFYNHCESDSEFFDNITDAKNFWLVHAHSHITDLLEDHNYTGWQDKKLKIETAKWALEKKDPDEFGNKSINNFINNQSNTFYPTHQAFHTDFMKAVNKRKTEAAQVVEGQVVQAQP